MGFVYEPISVAERVAVGLLVAGHHGPYGLVTGLARGLGTSRQFLYRLAARVRGAVIHTITRGSHAIQDQRQWSPPCAVRVDRRRLDRAMVTLALAGHTCQRAIAACLDELYGVCPSLGYINEVLGRASQAAQAVNAQLRCPPSRPVTEVAADALYVGRPVQLGARDPHSLRLLAVEALPAGQSVAAAAWAAVFARLPAHGVALERVASAGGKALAVAVARLPGVEHQLALGHGLRQVGRADRMAERHAYAALAQEETLAKKAQRRDPARPMGGSVWQRYETARAQATLAVQQYDDRCPLGQTRSWTSACRWPPRAAV